MVSFSFARRADDGSGSARRVNVVAILILLASVVIGLLGTRATESPVPLIALIVAGFVLMQAPQIAQQWERGVVLKLGRFVGLRGPGLFWMVHDAQKAALEVQDYAPAVSWAAQTALRDIIGRTELADLLRGREQIEAELQQLIDQRSNPWGVTVSSVEMRDIVIPVALQDAMSREAQASREKRARIILGQAETEIAQSFQEAARSYHDNPTALHLRAMNMLYEGLKEKGALMLIPSSAVESMGMGGMLGAAALRQEKLTGGTGT